MRFSYFLAYNVGASGSGTQRLKRLIRRRTPRVPQAVYGAVLQVLVARLLVQMRSKPTSKRTAPAPSWTETAVQKCSERNRMASPTGPGLLVPARPQGPVSARSGYRRTMDRKASIPPAAQSATKPPNTVMPIPIALLRPDHSLTRFFPVRLMSL